MEKMPDLRASLLAAGVIRAFQVSLPAASFYCELNFSMHGLKEGKPVVTTFQFRLNGIIISRLMVRPRLLDGNPDRWELVACDEKLGEFAIDDNEGLADPVLTRFILEVRDVTIPPTERRFLPNKGWKIMTTRECLAFLESVDVIKRL